MTQIIVSARNDGSIPILIKRLFVVFVSRAMVSSYVCRAGFVVFLSATYGFIFRAFIGCLRADPIPCPETDTTGQGGTGCFLNTDKDHFYLIR